MQRRYAIAGFFGLTGSVTIVIALSLETADIAPEWLVACLLVAAASETIRVSLWLSRDILKDRLLLMLLAGYSWLPIGLALLAFGKAFGSMLPESAALHGLAAGAVACSIHAVAARAVAQRSDRLRALPVDTWGFVLLWVAAALRVLAPAGSPCSAGVPAIWCLAWVVFLTRHGSVSLCFEAGVQRAEAAQPSSVSRRGKECDRSKNRRTMTTITEQSPT